MIQITAQELLNGVEGLQTLLNMPLPIKISYCVARLIREVNNEYKLLSRVRQQIGQKYGEASNDGSFNISKEQQETFLEEYNNLMNTTISLNVEPIELKDLEEYIKLTPKDIINLMPFIKE